MKMDKVAGSGNDEFYTPKYAIEPLMKYIPQNSKIWCPFDTNESYFPLLFRSWGFEVINTHINQGQDFFSILPNDVNLIISNPPYSKKTEVLARLFSIGIPFAMLVGVVGLFESQKRFNLFKNNKFEIMYFNKRISFLKDYKDEKPALNPPFSSVYICSKFLPEQIMFEEIKK